MFKNRLTLSEHRMIGGVCGGIAEYLDIDPSLVRVIYAALTIFTCFSGFILYPILYWVIPNKYKA